MPPLDPIQLVLLLLVVATALAYLARRIGIPYPILLVLGGLALGLIPGLPAIELEPEVVFLLFLPPILFGAGFSTPIRDFKANMRSILLLAVGLVLFTTLVVGLVAMRSCPSSGGRARLRSARSSRHRTRSRQRRSSSGWACHSGS